MAQLRPRIVVCVCESLSRVRHFVTPQTETLQASVHGILQARILEWVAMPFSRGSSQPKDQTQVSHIAGTFFTVWITRGAQTQDRLTLKPHLQHRCLLRS